MVYEQLLVKVKHFFDTDENAMESIAQYQAKPIGLKEWVFGEINTQIEAFESMVQELPQLPADIVCYEIEYDRESLEEYYVAYSISERKLYVIREAPTSPTFAYHIDAEYDL